MISRELQIEIAKVTMELAASNPTGFQSFLAMLAKRVDEVSDQMIGAKHDEIFQAQGRAQEARELFTTLHNAPKLARELQTKDELRERANGRDQIRAR